MKTSSSWWPWPSPPFIIGHLMVIVVPEVEEVPFETQERVFKRRGEEEEVEFCGKKEWKEMEIWVVNDLHSFLLLSTNLLLLLPFLPQFVCPLVINELMTLSLPFHSFPWSPWTWRHEDSATLILDTATKAAADDDQKSLLFKLKSILNFWSLTLSHQHSNLNFYYFNPI